MKLHNFNPEDGSFDYIANDDGSPAIKFYQLGKSGTYFQLVTGADGSVNIDAKTVKGNEDISLGLWPLGNGSVYFQSETRPNWIMFRPSDAGGDIQIATGGAPYSHEVGLSFHFQHGGVLKLKGEK